MNPDTPTTLAAGHHEGEDEVKGLARHLKLDLRSSTENHLDPINAEKDSSRLVHHPQGDEPVTDTLCPSESTPGPTFSQPVAPGPRGEPGKGLQPAVFMVA
ncbi:unnamed protein product [Merluccius merluccius]